MISAALTSLSHRYTARFQNLLRLAYSLRHPPPMTQTMMLAIFASGGTSARPLRDNPSYLRSFSRRSLTFSTYLVRRNLSPLLKLLSNPNANFFTSLLLPPIILGSGESLVSLAFTQLNNLLLRKAGTLVQNSSISLLSTCSQQSSVMSISCTLSCSFSAISSSPAISRLSSEFRTRLRYIYISVSLNRLSLRTVACLRRSSATWMWCSIFFIRSATSFSSSSRSFQPAWRTFSRLYSSSSCISLVGKFLRYTQTSSPRSTYTPYLPPYFFMPNMRCPLAESRQRVQSSPAQVMLWCKTGKRSSSRLNNKTKLQGCLVLERSSLAKRADYDSRSRRKPTCCCSLGPQTKSGLCFNAHRTFRSQLLSCATAKLRPTVWNPKQEYSTLVILVNACTLRLAKVLAKLDSRCACGSDEKCTMTELQRSSSKSLTMRSMLSSDGCTRQMAVTPCSCSLGSWMWKQRVTLFQRRSFTLKREEFISRLQLSKMTTFHKFYPCPQMRCSRVRCSAIRLAA